jgi:hypothetical protein
MRISVAFHAMVFLLCMGILLWRPTQLPFQYILSADSTLLYQTPPNRWRPAHSPYRSQDSAWARSILKQAIYWKPKDSIIQQHRAIALYLVHQLKGKTGNPPDWLFTLSPSEQWAALQSNRAKAYCTQFSVLYSCLARIAGLTVREIESFGSNDQHATTETYDSDRGLWIYSDMLNGVVELRDTKESKNLVQLYNAIPNSAMEHWEFASADSLGNLQWLQAKHYQPAAAFNFTHNSTFHFYYEHNLKWVYSWQQKCIRFLSLKVWFERYGPVPVHPLVYYLKFILFALLGFSGINLLRYFWKKVFHQTPNTI